MSREDLERFLTDEDHSAIDRLFRESEQESDDFNVAETLDRHLYEALIQYDKNATLSRWLSLRFTGPHTDGRLAEQALEDILSALRREIIGASPANSQTCRVPTCWFLAGQCCSSSCSIRFCGC